jgi:tRNA A-37 threonylcarbamoyl transferase component Bud32
MLALEPGTIFARDFKVVRALARGGMGAVYVVEQLSTSKTRALKVLHAQLAGDPKIRQRFEQEARVAARIESDHIVDVVAAGIEEPGTPWLVMEFLKGTDLAAHLDKHGARPLAEVDEIFRQMGHALAAAHRAGLVHRDLKPENIFLAESRREGAPFTVKVLDFGIAKAIEASPNRATQAMGTPYWMAPEQCTDSRLIAPATDVWAMGLIAYSLITGACYWRCAREKNSSVAELILEMTTHALDAPSVRAREYGRDHLIPPGFDAWFARCVDRVIEHRYPDAAACVTALVKVLTQATAPVSQAPTLSPSQAPTFAGPAPSMPVSAPPQQWPGPPVVAPAAQQTPARPPWVVLIAAVVMFAACSGALFAWRVTGSGPRPRARMVDELAPRPVPLVAPMPAPGGPTMQPIEQGPAPVASARQDAVRVTLSSVEPTRGSAATPVGAAMIERALRPRTPGIERCVGVSEDSTAGNLGGELVVVIAVAGGGAVTHTRLDEVDSPSLDACVARELRHTPFPRGAGGTYRATYSVR